MAADTQSKQAPPSLDKPQIRLLGEVNETMVETFLNGLAEAEKGGGDIVVEITTGGGDAELARRLVLEVERGRSRLPGRRLLFLGKTQVQSAGITLMSAFPRQDRFLTRDTVLLIHSRQLETSIDISGPMRASLAEVIALKEQIELGLSLEEENFRRLIEGSDVTLEELCGKARHSWYLPADEALKLRLVAGLV
jgi:ATP-dependent protease ClpP protease subunit